VGTADDAIGNHDPFGAMALDKLDDLLTDHIDFPDVQLRKSTASAPSNGMMPTATFEARLRSGP
jgi:hypothetical protein